MNIIRVAKYRMLYPASPEDILRSHQIVGLPHAPGFVSDLKLWNSLATLIFILLLAT